MSDKPIASWMPALSGELVSVEEVPPPGYRPTWIEVHWNRLEDNLNMLRRYLSPGCAVMPVVKDNAYGHGLYPVASRLENRVEMLAVAILEEAVILRQKGIRKPILVLGGLSPTQEEQALQEDVVPVIFSADGLFRWEAAAARKGRKACFHLKVDTGMNRLGVLPEQLDSFLAAADDCRFAVCDGLMTHLASADLPDSSMTELQLRTFASCLERVRSVGHKPRWIHAANSAGILDYPASHFNLVRPGIALYGYDPQSRRERGLQPVLELKSRISLVKVIPAGSRVGYGGTFVARRETRLATVPIGYGDGYSRFWGNCGEVLVEGQRIPVAGCVSMDNITLDVTALPHAGPGMQVIIMGKSGREESNAAHLARMLNTIPYEVLTSLNSRISRAYLD